MRGPAGQVVATVLVVIATLASVHALGSIIEPGAWTGSATRITLLSAAAVVLTRALLSRQAPRQALRWPLLPSVVGGLVALWLVLGTYGGRAQGFDPVVGLGNFGRLADQLRAAAETVNSEVAPVVPTTPVELVAVLGAVACFLVADLLAVGLRLPAMTVLPLLALWIPALVIDGDIGAAPVALTIAPLLALLAIDPHATPQDGAAQTVQSTTTLATTAAVTAGALVLGGIASGVGPLAPRSWSDAFASQGSAVRLSDDLDMRRNLDERSDQVVLTYSGENARSLGPLRVYTASAFDGVRWLRSDSSSGDLFTAEEQLWPERVGATEEPASVSITLDSYRDSLLPIPVEPRSVDVDGEWRYAATQDEIRATTSSREGMSYAVTTDPRVLSPETLRGSNGPLAVDNRYLDVPESAHHADITELARNVTGSADDPYDQAMALQTWFRDSENFTYTTDVADAVTGDAVWDFLQDRNGYCVQFATSMTVMARTLGIPARLGVGFLAGDRTSGNTYVVTGEKSHAWPELYFPGTGWVRFEPTPATQTGPTPGYADPLLDRTGSAPVVETESEPTPTTSDESTSAPRTDDREVTTTTTVATTTTSTMPRRVGAGFLLVAAGFALLLFLARGRQGTDEKVQTLDSEWERLRRQLELRGFVWSPSTTPHGLPGAVDAYLDQLGVGADSRAAVADDLTVVSTVVERERYAPRDDASAGNPATVADVSERVDRLTAAVDRGISDPRRADDPNGLRVG
ncbi:Transglutaminase-like superfamily protein [Paraoerskovia marina]|uniref:Transglutaminase-like superfamily protein n=1 Tax=Paraoerskovia marina TaxID=545619 RepID=A0A1H1TRT8_9CELL|nr:DUF3488 and transglutaminase-like domain-containing protein [Paraoerskovia marina]SDS62927.1 Transglutaminase-like superfamily protein [Paraoerskovia marina]